MARESVLPVLLSWERRCNATRFQALTNGLNGMELGSLHPREMFFVVVDRQITWHPACSCTPQLQTLPLIGREMQSAFDTQTSCSHSRTLDRNPAVIVPHAEP
jgi:hypothetical protein